jgi:hypothetical protein
MRLKTRKWHGSFARRGAWGIAEAGDHPPALHLMAIVTYDANVQKVQ